MLRAAPPPSHPFGILPSRSQVLAGNTTPALRGCCSLAPVPPWLRQGMLRGPCWALGKRQRGGRGAGCSPGCSQEEKATTGTPPNAIFLQGWEQHCAGAQRAHASLRGGGRDRAASKQRGSYSNSPPPGAAFGYGALTFSGQGCDDGQGQEGPQGGHRQQ